MSTSSPLELTLQDLAPFLEARSLLGTDTDTLSLLKNSILSSEPHEPPSSASSSSSSSSSSTSSSTMSHPTASPINRTVNPSTDRLQEFNSPYAQHAYEFFHSLMESIQETYTTFPKTNEEPNTVPSSETIRKNSGAVDKVSSDTFPTSSLSLALQTTSNLLAAFDTYPDTVEVNSRSSLPTRNHNTKDNESSLLSILLPLFEQLPSLDKDTTNTTSFPSQTNLFPWPKEFDEFLVTLVDAQSHPTPPSSTSGSPSSSTVQKVVRDILLYFSFNRLKEYNNNTYRFSNSAYSHSYLGSILRIVWYALRIHNCLLASSASSFLSSNGHIVTNDTIHPTDTSSLTIHPLIDERIQRIHDYIDTTTYVSILTKNGENSHNHFHHFLNYFFHFTENSKWNQPFLQRYDFPSSSSSPHSSLSCCLDHSQLVRTAVIDNATIQPNDSSCRHFLPWSNSSLPFVSFPDRHKQSPSTVSSSSYSIIKTCSIYLPVPEESTSSITGSTSLTIHQQLIPSLSNHLYILWSIGNSYHLTYGHFIQDKGIEIYDTLRLDNLRDGSRLYAMYSYAPGTLNDTVRCVFTNPVDTTPSVPSSYVSIDVTPSTDNRSLNRSTATIIQRSPFPLSVSGTERMNLEQYLYSSDIELLSSLYTMGTDIYGIFRRSGSNDSLSLITLYRFIYDTSARKYILRNETKLLDKDRGSIIPEDADTLVTFFDGTLLYVTLMPRADVPCRWYAIALNGSEIQVQPLFSSYIDYPYSEVHRWNVTGVRTKDTELAHYYHTDTYLSYIDTYAVSTDSTKSESNNDNKIILRLYWIQNSRSRCETTYGTKSMETNLTQSVTSVSTTNPVSTPTKSVSASTPSSSPLKYGRLFSSPSTPSKSRMDTSFPSSSSLPSLPSPKVSFIEIFTSFIVSLQHTLEFQMYTDESLRLMLLDNLPYFLQQLYGIIGTFINGYDNLSINNDPSIDSCLQVFIKVIDDLLIWYTRMNILHVTKDIRTANGKRLGSLRTESLFTVVTKDDQPLEHPLLSLYGEFFTYLRSSDKWKLLSTTKSLLTQTLEKHIFLFECGKGTIHPSIFFPYFRPFSPSLTVSVSPEIYVLTIGDIVLYPCDAFQFALQMYPGLAIDILSLLYRTRENIHVSLSNEFTVSSLSASMIELFTKEFYALYHATLAIAFHSSSVSSTPNGESDHGSRVTTALELIDTLLANYNNSVYGNILSQFSIDDLLRPLPSLISLLPKHCHGTERLMNIGRTLLAMMTNPDAYMGTEQRLSKESTDTSTRKKDSVYKFLSPVTMDTSLNSSRMNDQVPLSADDLPRTFVLDDNNIQWIGRSFETFPLRGTSGTSMTLSFTVSTSPGEYDALLLVGNPVERTDYDSRSNVGNIIPGSSDHALDNKVDNESCLLPRSSAASSSLQHLSATLEQQIFSHHSSSSSSSSSTPGGSNAGTNSTVNVHEWIAHLRSLIQSDDFDLVYTSDHDDIDSEIAFFGDYSTVFQGSNHPANLRMNFATFDDAMRSSAFRLFAASEGIPLTTIRRIQQDMIRRSLRSWTPTANAGSSNEGTTIDAIHTERIFTFPVQNIANIYDTRKIVTVLPIIFSKDGNTTKGLGLRTVSFTATDNDPLQFTMLMRVPTKNRVPGSKDGRFRRVKVPLSMLTKYNPDACLNLRILHSKKTVSMVSNTGTRVTGIPNKERVDGIRSQLVNLLLQVIQYLSKVECVSDDDTVPQSVPCSLVKKNSSKAASIPPWKMVYRSSFELDLRDNGCTIEADTPLVKKVSEIGTSIAAVSSPLQFSLPVSRTPSAMNDGSSAVSRTSTGASSSWLSSPALFGTSPLLRSLQIPSFSLDETQNSNLPSSPFSLGNMNDEASSMFTVNPSEPGKNSIDNETDDESHLLRLWMQPVNQIAPPVDMSSSGKAETKKVSGYDESYWIKNPLLSTGLRGLPGVTTIENTSDNLVSVHTFLQSIIGTSRRRNPNPDTDTLLLPIKLRNSETTIGTVRIQQPVSWFWTLQNIAKQQAHRLLRETAWDISSVNRTERWLSAIILWHSNQGAKVLHAYYRYVNETITNYLKDTFGILVPFEAVRIGEENSFTSMIDGTVDGTGIAIEAIGIARKVRRWLVDCRRLNASGNNDDTLLYEKLAYGIEQRCQFLFHFRPVSSVYRANASTVSETFPSLLITHVLSFVTSLHSLPTSNLTNLWNYCVAKDHMYQYRTHSFELVCHVLSSLYLSDAYSSTGTVSVPTDDFVDNLMTIISSYRTAAYVNRSLSSATLMIHSQAVSSLCGYLSEVMNQYLNHKFTVTDHQPDRSNPSYKLFTSLLKGLRLFTVFVRFVEKSNGEGSFLTSSSKNISNAWYQTVLTVITKCFSVCTCSSLQDKRDVVDSSPEPVDISSLCSISASRLPNQAKQLLSSRPSNTSTLHWDSVPDGWKVDTGSSANSRKTQDSRLEPAVIPYLEITLPVDFGFLFSNLDLYIGTDGGRNLSSTPCPEVPKEVLISVSPSLTDTDISPLRYGWGKEYLQTNGDMDTVTNTQNTLINGTNSSNNVSSYVAQAWSPVSYSETIACGGTWSLVKKHRIILPSSSSTAYSPWITILNRTDLTTLGWGEKVSIPDPSSSASSTVVATLPYPVLRIRIAILSAVDSSSMGLLKALRIQSFPFLRPILSFCIHQSIGIEALSIVHDQVRKETETQNSTDTPLYISLLPLVTARHISPWVRYLLYLGPLAIVRSTAFSTVENRHHDFLTAVTTVLPTLIKQSLDDIHPFIKLSCTSLLSRNDSIGERTAATLLPVFLSIIETQHPFVTLKSTQDLKPLNRLPVFKSMMYTHDTIHTLLSAFHYSSNISSARLGGCLHVFHQCLTTAVTKIVRQPLATVYGDEDAQQLDDDWVSVWTLFHLLHRWIISPNMLASGIGKSLFDSDHFYHPGHVVYCRSMTMTGKPGTSATTTVDIDKGIILHRLSKEYAMVLPLPHAKDTTENLLVDQQVLILPTVNLYPLPVDTEPVSVAPTLLLFLRTTLPLFRQFIPYVCTITENSSLYPRLRAHAFLVWYTLQQIIVQCGTEAVAIANHGKQNPSWKTIVPMNAADTGRQYLYPSELFTALVNCIPSTVLTESSDRESLSVRMSEANGSTHKLPDDLYHALLVLALSSPSTVSGRKPDESLAVPNSLSLSQSNPSVEPTDHRDNDILNIHYRKPVSSDIEEDKKDEPLFSEPVHSSASSSSIESLLSSSASSSSSLTVNAVENKEIPNKYIHSNFGWSVSLFMNENLDSRSPSYRTGTTDSPSFNLSTGTSSSPTTIPSSPMYKVPPRIIVHIDDEYGRTSHIACNILAATPDLESLHTLTTRPSSAPVHDDATEEWEERRIPTVERLLPTLLTTNPSPSSVTVGNTSSKSTENGILTRLILPEEASSIVMESLKTASFSSPLPLYGITVLLQYPDALDSPLLSDRRRQILEDIETVNKAGGIAVISLPNATAPAAAYVYTTLRASDVPHHTTSDESVDNAISPSFHHSFLVLVPEQARVLRTVIFDMRQWGSSLRIGSLVDAVLPLTGAWAKAIIIAQAPEPFVSWFRVEFVGLGGNAEWRRWVTWEHTPLTNTSSSSSSSSSSLSPNSTVVPSRIVWGPSEMAPYGWITGSLKLSKEGSFDRMNARSLVLSPHTVYAPAYVTSSVDGTIHPAVPLANSESMPPDLFANDSETRDRVVQGLVAVPVIESLPQFTKDGTPLYARGNYTSPLSNPRSPTATATPKPSKLFYVATSTIGLTNALEFWRSTVTVGTLINARDNHSKWYEARIVETVGLFDVRVRYLGWCPSSNPDRYDERIARNSGRILPKDTKIRDWRRIQIGEEVEVRDDRSVDSSVVTAVDAGRNMVRLSEGGNEWYALDDIFRLACFGTHRRPRQWADIDWEPMNQGLPALANRFTTTTKMMDTGKGSTHSTAKPTLQGLDEDNNATTTNASVSFVKLEGIDIPQSTNLMMNGYPNATVAELELASETNHSTALLAQVWSAYTQHRTEQKNDNDNGKDQANDDADPNRRANGKLTANDRNGRTEPSSTEGSVSAVYDALQACGIVPSNGLLTLSRSSVSMNNTTADEQDTDDDEEEEEEGKEEEVECTTVAKIWQQVIAQGDFTITNGTATVESSGTTTTMEPVHVSPVADNDTLSSIPSSSSTVKVAPATFELKPTRVPSTIIQLAEKNTSLTMSGWLRLPSSNTTNTSAGGVLLYQAPLLELQHPVAPGTLVEGRYASVTWYPSRVESARPDGTYVVAYEDGDRSLALSRDRMRLRSNARQAFSVVITPTGHIQASITILTDPDNLPALPTTNSSINDYPIPHNTITHATGRFTGGSPGSTNGSGSTSTVVPPTVPGTRLPNTNTTVSTDNGPVSVDHEENDIDDPWHGPLRVQYNRGSTNTNHNGTGSTNPNTVDTNATADEPPTTIPSTATVPTTAASPPMVPATSTVNPSPSVSTLSSSSPLSATNILHRRLLEAAPKGIQSIVSRSTLSSSEWTHVVVSVTNGVFTLYINGIAEDSLATEIYERSSTVYIGGACKAALEEDEVRRIQTYTPNDGSNDNSTGKCVTVSDGSVQIFTIQQPDTGSHSSLTILDRTNSGSATTTTSHRVRINSALFAPAPSVYVHGLSVFTKWCSEKEASRLMQKGAMKELFMHSSGSSPSVIPRTIPYDIVFESVMHRLQPSNPYAVCSSSSSSTSHVPSFSRRLNNVDTLFTAEDEFWETQGQWFTGNEPTFPGTDNDNTAAFAHLIEPLIHLDPEREGSGVNSTDNGENTHPNSSTDRDEIRHRLFGGDAEDFFRPHEPPSSASLSTQRTARSTLSSNDTDEDENDRVFSRPMRVRRRFNAGQNQTNAPPTSTAIDNPIEAPERENRRVSTRRVVFGPTMARDTIPVGTSSSISNSSSSASASLTVHDTLSASIRSDTTVNSTIGTVNGEMVSPHTFLRLNALRQVIEDNHHDNEVMNPETAVFLPQETEEFEGTTELSIPFVNDNSHDNSSTVKDTDTPASSSTDVTPSIVPTIPSSTTIVNPLDMFHRNTVEEIKASLTTCIAKATRTRSLRTIAQYMDNDDPLAILMMKGMHCGLPNTPSYSSSQPDTRTIVPNGGSLTSPATSTPSTPLRSNRASNANVNSRIAATPPPLPSGASVGSILTSGSNDSIVQLLQPGTLVYCDLYDKRLPAIVQSAHGSSVTGVRIGNSNTTAHRKYTVTVLPCTEAGALGGTNAVVESHNMFMLRPRPVTGTPSRPTLSMYTTNDRSTLQASVPIITGSPLTNPSRSLTIASSPLLNAATNEGGNSGNGLPPRSFTSPPSASSTVVPNYPLPPPLSLPPLLTLSPMLSSRSPLRQQILEDFSLLPPTGTGESSARPSASPLLSSASPGRVLPASGIRSSRETTPIGGHQSQRFVSIQQYATEMAGMRKLRGSIGPSVTASSVDDHHHYFTIDADAIAKMEKDQAKKIIHRTLRYGLTNILRHIFTLAGTGSVHLRYRGLCGKERNEKDCEICIHNEAETGEERYTLVPSVTFAWSRKASLRSILRYLSVYGTWPTTMNNFYGSIVVCSTGRRAILQSIFRNGLGSTVRFIGRLSKADSFYTLADTDIDNVRLVLSTAQFIVSIGPLLLQRFVARDPHMAGTLLSLGVLYLTMFVNETITERIMYIKQRYGYSYTQLYRLLEAVDILFRVLFSTNNTKDTLLSSEQCSSIIESDTFLQLLPILQQHLSTLSNIVRIANKLPTMVNPSGSSSSSVLTSEESSVPSPSTTVSLAEAISLCVSGELLDDVSLVSSVLFSTNGNPTASSSTVRVQLPTDTANTVDGQPFYRLSPSRFIQVSLNILQTCTVAGISASSSMTKDTLLTPLLRLVQVRKSLRKLLHDNSSSERVSSTVSTVSSTPYEWKWTPSTDAALVHSIDYLYQHKRKSNGGSMLYNIPENVFNDSFRSTENNNNTALPRSTNLAPEAAANTRPRSAIGTRRLSTRNGSVARSLPSNNPAAPLVSEPVTRTSVLVNGVSTAPAPVLGRSTSGTTHNGTVRSRERERKQDTDSDSGNEQKVPEDSYHPSFENKQQESESETLGLYSFSVACWLSLHLPWLQWDHLVAALRTSKGIMDVPHDSNVEPNNVSTFDVKITRREDSVYEGYLTQSSSDSSHSNIELDGLFKQRTDGTVLHVTNYTCTRLHSYVMQALRQYHHIYRKIKSSGLVPSFSSETLRDLHHHPLVVIPKVVEFIARRLLLLWQFNSAILMAFPLLDNSSSSSSNSCWTVLREGTTETMNSDNPFSFFFSRTKDSMILYRHFLFHVVKRTLLKTGLNLTRQHLPHFSSVTGSTNTSSTRLSIQANTAMRWGSYVSVHPSSSSSTYGDSTGSVPMRNSNIPGNNSGNVNGTRESISSSSSASGTSAFRNTTDATESIQALWDSDTTGSTLQDYDEFVLKDCPTEIYVTLRLAFFLTPIVDAGLPSTIMKASNATISSHQPSPVTIPVRSTSSSSSSSSSTASTTTVLMNTQPLTIDISDSSSSDNDNRDDDDDTEDDGTGTGEEDTTNATDAEQLFVSRIPSRRTTGNAPTTNSLSLGWNRSSSSGDFTARAESILATLTAIQQQATQLPRRTLEHRSTFTATENRLLLQVENIRRLVSRSENNPNPLPLTPIQTVGSTGISMNEIPIPLSTGVIRSTNHHQLFIPRLLDGAVTRVRLSRWIDNRKIMQNNKNTHTSIAAGTDPFLIVSKEHLFIQLYNNLYGTILPSQFRQTSRPWRIDFAGEGGTDAGGLFAEALTTAVSEVMGSKIMIPLVGMMGSNNTASNNNITNVPLFIPTPNHRLDTGTGREYCIPNTDIWYNNNTDAKPSISHTPSVMSASHHLVFIGRLMGISLRLNFPLPFLFPEIVWRLIVEISSSSSSSSKDDSSIMDNIPFQAYRYKTIPFLSSLSSSPSTPVLLPQAPDWLRECDITLARTIDRCYEILLVQQVYHRSYNQKKNDNKDKQDESIAEEYRHYMQQLCAGLSTSIPSFSGNYTYSFTTTAPSSRSTAGSEGDFFITQSPSTLYRFIYQATILRIRELLPSIEALMQGIYSVIPLSYLTLFHPTELEYLFGGQPGIDITVLQQHTRYEGWRRPLTTTNTSSMTTNITNTNPEIALSNVTDHYTSSSSPPSSPDSEMEPFSTEMLQESVPTSSTVTTGNRWSPRQHPTVIAFWNVLRDMTPEEQEKVLMFIYARHRLPPTETVWTHQFTLCRMARDNPDNSLPAGHTCGFQLDLPEYSNETVLRRQLLRAANECVGYDLDGGAVGILQ